MLEELIGGLAGLAATGALAFQAAQWWSGRATDTCRKRLNAFVAGRKHLSDNYCAVSEQALQVNAQWLASRDTRVLGQPSWLLEPAVPLDKIAITLTNETDLRELAGMRKRWSTGWPCDHNEHELARYSEAIEVHGHPELWWDSNVYRLLRVTASDGSLALDFALGTYFDAFDTQEVLAFDAARRVAAGLSLAPTYATLSGGPLSFTNRCAATSIVTLTIVRAAHDARFFLHWRDPRLVAIGGGTFHGTPAGEFEPTGRTPHATRADFSLWRNMMREYAEEYLGYKEYDGTDGMHPDYSGASPFKELNGAVAAGLIRPWCLGIGLNPLSCKAEILTAVVFDQAIFDDVFQGLEADDPEGRKLGQKQGDTRRGLLFDYEHVQEYLEDKRTNPVTHALLTQAWKNREVLLATKDGFSQEQDCCV